MDFRQFVRRSLTYYWRTNLAVVLGVATAVAVLAGALLVGDSVRGSLADLVQQRLGATDLAIVAPQFFREQLAADLSADPRFAGSFRAAAPMIVADAVVTDQESGRRAGHVKVYGVDARFWRFHGVQPVALESQPEGACHGVAAELDGFRRSVRESPCFPEVGNSALEGFLETPTLSSEAWVLVQSPPQVCPGPMPSSDDAKVSVPVQVHADARESENAETTRTARPSFVKSFGDTVSSSSRNRRATTARVARARCRPQARVPEK